MSRMTSLLALFLALALFALSCGSDDTSTLAVGDSPTAAPQADDATNDGEPAADETPMPVEPDGGIGDGAEPLPGAPKPVFDGDWHGAELAETNCPGTSWKQIDASVFSFAVPVDFVDDQAQGIDSEVGSWTGSGIDVAFDYGWYTGPLDQFPGVEITDIDYSGVRGQLGVVRQADGDGGANIVGVYFPNVAPDGDQWNALGLNVWFDDAGDEIIARCIVGSIEWADAA